MEFTKDIKFNTSPTVGEDLTVTYNGFLSSSAELFMVSGFGESWENTTETQMNKIETGFTAKINLLDSDTFNFCFRNSNNEWDNNSNCNYISPILPAIIEETNEIVEEQNIQNFDIDALIEELLQPLTISESIETEDTSAIQINSKNIDLGVEITKLLSQIDSPSVDNDSVETFNAAEFLDSMIISETPVEEFENKREKTINLENKIKQSINIDKIVNEIIEETVGITNITENVLSPEYTKNLFTVEEKSEPSSILNEENETATALISLETPFKISPRKLSKFYLLRKRIKLALYKALIRIPKLIFGTEK